MQENMVRLGKLRFFAVFPSYAIGRNAFWNLLKREDYIDLTLDYLPRRYTGVKVEDPDTQEVIDYRNDIKKITKFDMQRTIRSLSDKEYEQLIDAMERHEGWDFGFEEYIEVKKIIGVHLNKKKIISEFFVADLASSIWMSRFDAILLAEEGKLHAIVVHTKQEKYLRPEYHQTPFKQMIC